MSVAAILEQVKQLDRAEKKALAKEIIDLLDESPNGTHTPTIKTGAEIVAMLEALDAPIGLVDPHIEDPVEWVKAQRKKRAAKLQA
jgi:hypothetical protein